MNQEILDGVEETDNEFAFGGIAESSVALKVIQYYLQPELTIKFVETDVGEEYVKKADGLVISVICPPNNTSKIIYFGRKVTQSINEAICMVSDNGPEENSPQKVLRQLIDKLTK